MARPNKEMADDHDSIECHSLRRCFAVLAESIQHDVSLASNKLYERGLLTREVHGWLLTTKGVSDYDKASRLLTCVLDKVKSSKQLYHEFLDILKDELYFKDIVETISTEHSMFKLAS